MKSHVYVTRSLTCSKLNNLHNHGGSQSVNSSVFQGTLTNKKFSSCCNKPEQIITTSEMPCKSRHQCTRCDVSKGLVNCDFKAFFIEKSLKVGSPAITLSCVDHSEYNHQKNSQIKDNQNL